MIRFKCACGQSIKMPDDAAGKHGKCPKCGNKLTIPTPDKDNYELEPLPAPEQVVVHRVEPQPSPAPTPQVNVKIIKSGNGAAMGLGIGALVLGLLGLLVSWVPVVGCLALPLGGLGLLLGGIGIILALTTGGRGIGMPIAGTVVSIVALGIMFIVAAGTAATMNQISEEMAKAVDEAQATNQIPAAQIEEDAEQNSPLPQTHAEQWADASNPVMQGDVQISVLSATVETIELTNSYGGGNSQSKDEDLRIRIAVMNRSKTRKIQYETWRGADVSFQRDYATFADAHGNRYKRLDFGFSKVPVGGVTSESLYPDTSAVDVLLFERPIDTFGHLDLELPAKHFGGQGMIRLRIPADLVK